MRAQESFNKKEVRNKKEKKRKEKEQKRLARKDNAGKKGNSLDDMIAYVDENGNITSTPPDPDKKKEIDIDDIQVSVPRKSDVEEDPVHKGIVKAFFETKGYGFINDSGTEQGVFFHVNNLLEAVEEGNLVTFEIEMGKKGPVAVNVKRIEGNL
jgi:cold shock CspA family protein